MALPPSQRGLYPPGPGYVHTAAGWVKAKTPKEKKKASPAPPKYVATAYEDRTYTPAEAKGPYRDEAKLKDQARKDKIKRQQQAAREKMLANEQAKEFGLKSGVMPWELKLFKPDKIPKPPTIRFDPVRPPGTAWDGKPVVHNRDGTTSSVRSMSFREHGYEILVPTVWDGRVHSDDAAIARYHATGDHLGKYLNVKQANAAADLLHRQEEQRGAMGFTTLGPKPMTWQERAASDEKERRERAKLVAAAGMPGSKAREEYIRGMSPAERKQLEKMRTQPAPEKLSIEQRLDRATKEGAGFLPFDTHHLGSSVLAKAPGDFWKFLSGTYGMAADYSHAASSDFANVAAFLSAAGRGGQGAPPISQAIPRKTAGLVKRDALGLAGAYETAVPEFPSWMGGDFQVIAYDPEKGFKIAQHDAAITEQGRKAFREVWTNDPFLTALLFVPVLTATGKVASINALKRSISKANPGLSARTVARFAREESGKPGYLWGQGIRGGLRQRKIGVDRNLPEATEIDRVDRAPNLQRYDKGRPGYEVKKIKGETHVVYRDTSGTPRAYVIAGKDTIRDVYTAPELRRQGIAKEMYAKLERHGIDVRALSGAGPMTVEGRALAASLDQVPGRPWSRSPHGRAIQRGYDKASDWVEVYLGPNAAVLGKWAMSNRATRAKQSRIYRDAQREGATIERDTHAIAKAISAGPNEAAAEAALFAALQGPKRLSERRGVELMRDHLALQEEPPQPVIELLNQALEGTWLDEQPFKDGLKAMERTSAQGSRMYQEVTGASAWDLADRRDRITRAYEEAGLLDDDAGGLPPEFGGELPGPGPLQSRMIDLERQLENVDPNTPAGQALMTDLAQATQEFHATRTRVAALADQIAKDEVFDAQWWEGSKTGNVNYLPEGAKDAAGLSKLIHEVYDRTVEGYPYGHAWYEGSGQTILRMAGGDVERADRLAALMAIYSPQRAVTPNYGLALRAEQEFARTKNVTLGNSGQQKQAVAALSGKDWRDELGSEAPKIRRFYGNLLKHIDRGRMVERGYTGREATIDGWIAAAFHYGTNTKTVSINVKQYEFMERVVQKIADDLGIDPEQAQAAMWVSIKASNDRYLQGVPRERALQAASGSFSQAADLATHNVRFAFEAASDQIPEYKTWAPEVQQVFMDSNANAVLHAFQSEGMYARLTDHGIGVYLNKAGEIETNPQVALEISVGSLPTDTRLHLSEGQKALYDGMAGVVADNLLQESGGWLRPLVAKAALEHTHFRMTHAGITPEQTSHLTGLLDDVGYVTPTKDGLIVAAFDADGILDATGAALRKAESTAFRDRVVAALDEVFGEQTVSTIMDEGRLQGGAHRGGFLEGHEQYRDSIDSSGRPDLLGRIDHHLSATTAEIRDAFIADPERAARDYGARAAPPVEDYRWEARGYFPHRNPNEFIPGSIQPTALAAGGNAVGVAKPGRALERRRNELELYASGKVNMKPQVLANTVRGRIKYRKTVEGRQYLYDRGVPILEDAVIGEGKYYFVRNPDSLPTKIPDDVKAILAHPDDFMKGDADKLKIWRNEWIKEVDGGVPLSKQLSELAWAGDLKNVRLVPAGNVETMLADAFYSAPRGTLPSITALLNSAARTVVIYTPFGGSRYVIRNTAQNMILMALTHPTAFKYVGRSVHTVLRGDKDLWDAMVIQTGGFPAAAGLPEMAARGTSRVQRAEKAATRGQRAFAGMLSNIADEPFRVAALIKYAEEYGFKGQARLKELMTSEEPGIRNVRDQISQQVRDDMLDFNTLSPAVQEKAARYLFILPFQAAALKWPVTFVRDQTMRAAIVALVAAQHEREDGQWGEVMLNGRMVSLSWLSPIAPALQTAGAISETIKASTGGPDLSALAGLLSPEWRDLVRSLQRGGLSWDQMGKTWVPMYKSGKEIIAYSRGQENLDELILSYLGAKPYNFSKSAKGDAAKWGESAADLWGSIPKELVAAKASKAQYERDIRVGPDETPKTEHEKVKIQAEYYFKAHPEEKSNRARWLERIRTTKTDELDNWTGFFDKELGWADVTKMDSRLDVYESMNDYLTKHPEDEHFREQWRQSIVHATDDRLSEWRKFLTEQEEAAA